jgi:hypothetical protein
MKERMVDIATGVTIIVLLAIVLFNLSGCAAFQGRYNMAPVVKEVCAMACDSAEDLTTDQCNDICSNVDESIADTCSVACSIAIEIGGPECNRTCTDKLNEVIKSIDNRPSLASFSKAQQINPNGNQPVKQGQEDTMGDTNSLSNGSSNDTGAQNQNNEPKISNSDVKAHPLFQSVTSQMADLKKRLESFESAENDRRTKALEDEQQYEEAAKLRAEQAVEAARSEWESERNKADAMSKAELELVRLGFSNKAFVKGLLADFDPSTMNADDFAKSAYDNDDNKPFLTGAQKQPRPKGDTPPPPNSSMKRLSPEQLRTLQNSDKSEDRKRANAYALENWIRDGKTGLKQ